MSISGDRRGEGAFLPVDLGARDGPHVHLVWPVEDPHRPMPAVEPGQRRVVADPGRAVHLDGTVRGLLPQLAAVGFDAIEVSDGTIRMSAAKRGAVITAILDAGFEVLVETNGSLPIETLPKAAARVMDVKCPGSGESGRMRWENMEFLGPRDDVKFVIGSREDYEWAKGVMERFGLSRRATVLLSPVHGLLAPSELAEWMVADGLDARMQLQLHKYIWGEGRRGV